MQVEFTPFPKISRLKREVIVTEKIDGTNSAVVVTDEGEVFAQSRNRIITVNDDNFGFANWVEKNKEELSRTLGPGVHFGEWWGAGIQRGYGLKFKRFSLFNVHQWHAEPDAHQCIEAPLCYVVPILATIEKFDTAEIDKVFENLRESGSIASPGFRKPEGIVIFHSQNQALYKQTYEYDATGKGQ